MIYKLQDFSRCDDNYLEFYRNREEEVTFIINCEEERVTVSLDEDKLYKLIGALHLIQKELKEVSNAKR